MHIHMSPLHTYLCIHIEYLLKKAKNVAQNATARPIEQQVDDEDEYSIIDESDGEVSTQHHDIMYMYN